MMKYGLAPCVFQLINNKYCSYSVSLGAWVIACWFTRLLQQDVAAELTWMYLRVLINQQAITHTPKLARRLSDLGNRGYHINF